MTDKYEDSDRLCERPPVVITPWKHLQVWNLIINLKVSYIAFDDASSGRIKQGLSKDWLFNNWIIRIVFRVEALVVGQHDKTWCSEILHKFCKVRWHEGVCSIIWHTWNKQDSKTSLTFLSCPNMVMVSLLSMHQSCFFDFSSSMMDAWLLFGGQNSL